MSKMLSTEWNDSFSYNEIGPNYTGNTHHLSVNEAFPLSNFKWDDKMERLLSSGSTELMPDKDDDGITYLVFRLEKWDPAVDSIHEVYRACIFLWEYILLEYDTVCLYENNTVLSESVQVNGIKVVGDQGSLVGHVT